MLTGFVKLTSTQLVGESIVAISVLLDAILKLENMDYFGKGGYQKVLLNLYES